MLKLLILITMLVSQAQSAEQETFSVNLVGGFFSTQADAGVARVADATSPVNNPAGLGKIIRNSVSSGASSYNARLADQEADPTISSSTNHVSYIKSSEKFNLGMMIYTINSGFEISRTYTSSRNTEGLPNTNSTTEAANNNNNYYVLALSPKNSNWGISLVGLSYNINNLTSGYTHTFSNTDSTLRSYSAGSTNTDLSLFSAAAALGFQYQWAMG